MFIFSQRSPASAFMSVYYNKGVGQALFPFIIKSANELNNPDATSGQIFHSCCPRMCSAAIAQRLSQPHTHMCTQLLLGIYHGGVLQRGCMQRQADPSVKNINQPSQQNKCVFYPLLCIAMIRYHRGSVSCSIMWAQAAVCLVHVNIRRA